MLYSNIGFIHLFNPALIIISLIPTQVRMMFQPLLTTSISTYPKFGPCKFGGETTRNSRIRRPKLNASKIFGLIYRLEI